MRRLTNLWSKMSLLLLQLSILPILLGASTSEGADKYYCKISRQHTMCITTGVGPACGGTVYERGVSDPEAAEIVAAHNNFRAKVALGLETRGSPGPQPQAADMMEMTWDDELAVIAQRHADQCVFEHDFERSVERFAVGQNLYTMFQSNHDQSNDWDGAIKAWYYEVDEVPANMVAHYKSISGTGHYTQLVWGSTNKVGCGYTMYREGGWYKKLYTCNYGPAGNVMRTPMYQSGPPCSKCPDDTFCSPTHPGLCGVDDAQHTTLVTLLTNFPTTSHRNTSSLASPQPTSAVTECCPCS